MKFSNGMAQTAQEMLFHKALAITGPKRRDYSGSDSPFANFYNSQAVGVPAWQGAMVRLMDKVVRIANLAQVGGTGEVKDESLLDTAADLLNYTVISLCLIIESLPEEKAMSMMTSLGFDP